MLASSGLRICDSGDNFIAMISSAGTSRMKSASPSSFQWDGTRYLILPTLVEPTSATTTNTGITTTNTGITTTTCNCEQLTQRSFSDSGVSIRSGNNLRKDNGFKDIQCEKHDSNNEHLSNYSRKGRLSFNRRSMSLDALCTENNSNLEWDSSLSLPNNNIKDNNSGGRGYVEWKTCSSWLQNTEARMIHGLDSRGYVEFDTIWTTTAPWLRKSANEDHVYDDVAKDNLTYCDRTVPAYSPEKTSDVSVAIETPPALPERTYISRLKNNNDTDNSSRTISGVSSPCSQRHKYSHRLHLNQHDSTNSRKHHHHHRHHHRNNNNQKEHRFLTSATSSTGNSVTCKSPSSTHSHETSPPTAQFHKITKPHQVAVDNPPNYAEVHKLKGYKFTHLINVHERQIPHHHNKSAIYSENYHHLAPLTAPGHAASWHSGDVLDYIDGLHDSMSSKRRENIYILLNNKQTRAKFSESLEIESRLLSKGLISGSSSTKSMLDKLGVPDNVSARSITNLIKQGITKPIIAKAPVTSTYV